MQSTGRARRDRLDGEVPAGAGDENRLRILMLLRERELCVLEVVGALGISQPLASSHLAVLREAGLATARREGRRIRYSLSRGGEARRQAPVARAGGGGDRRRAADRGGSRAHRRVRGVSRERRLRQEDPRQFPHEKESLMNRIGRTLFALSLISAALLLAAARLRRSSG